MTANPDRRPPLRGALRRRPPRRMPAPAAPLGRRASRSLSGALVLAMLLLGAVASFDRAAPAQAYTAGDMLNFGGWWVGSFQLPNGRFVFCLEPGAEQPMHTDPTPRVVDTLRGYSVEMWDQTGWNGRVSTGPITGEPLRRINYLLAQHGSTRDPATAVAVQFALWMLRGGAGEAAWLAHHIDWVEQHGGAASIALARDLANEAIDQAHAPTVPHPGALQLAAGADFATGTLSYPAGTTVLSLEGAVFADGAPTLHPDPSTAGSVPWSATLHDPEWLGSHPVRATGDWSASATGWPALLEVFPSPVPEEQTLTWTAGPVTEQGAGAFDTVTHAVDARFRPTLSTRVVERWIGHDAEPFRDRVTVAADPLAAPWPTRIVDGAREHAPLLASGTVYGPFTHPQTPAAAAPSGAPVAGRATLVIDRGPGTYEVATAERPDESGYYYWVWEISDAVLPASVRDAGLLPEGYRFVDDFGLEAEGHVVPTRLRWHTSLIEREISPTRLELTDRVTVRLHDGAWLRSDQGERIPARLRLTVYQEATRPERQAGVPSTAREIARAYIDTSLPSRTVTTETITLPAGTTGWVTVRTCLVAEDQVVGAERAFEEWCDDYGMPLETARITVAKALAETGSESPRLGLVGAGTLILALGGSLVLAGAARSRRLTRGTDSRSRPRL